MQDALRARILEGLLWPSEQKLSSVAPLLPSMLTSLCTHRQIMAKASSEAIMHLPVQTLLDATVLHLYLCNCPGESWSAACKMLLLAILPCPTSPCFTLPFLPGAQAPWLYLRNSVSGLILLFLPFLVKPPCTTMLTAAPALSTTLNVLYNVW